MNPVTLVQRYQPTYYSLPWPEDVPLPVPALLWWAEDVVGNSYPDPDPWRAILRLRRLVA